MISDPIGDILTRIRNGYLADKKTVLVPYSKNKEAVIKVLVEKEIVAGYEVETKGFKKTLILKLDRQQRRPLQIKRISKPGCRIYLSSKKIYQHKGDQGFLLISTSKGVMDSFKAKKLKVGGEVLAEIF